MFKKAGVCLLFFFSLFLSACVTWQPVKVMPGLNVNNEIIVKPELQRVISGRKQNLKIALRAPDAPKSVTQETQKDINKAYDRVERELSRAGFIVRDRELLEQIASGIKPASYMELAKAIDTDLILELIYIGPCDLSHKTYCDINTGRLCDLVNPDQELKQPGSLAFAMRGGQIDCRVISVRDGTVSGMFTIYNLPCDGLCDFEVNDNKQWRNPEPNPEQNKGWGVGADDQNFHQLVELLTQTLNDGDIVVSKVQPKSPAAQHGLAVNDVVEKINGQALYNLSQAQEMIVKTNGKIEFLLKRDGKEITVSFMKKLAENIGAGLVFKSKVYVDPPEPPVVAEVKPAAAPVPAPVIAQAAAAQPAPEAPKQQAKHKLKKVKKATSDGWGG